MNILNVEKVSKTYGEKQLFDEVNKGDKIGVIGVNGTGKSTFLKIIAGLEEADAGQVVKGKGVTVAYLEQKAQFPEKDTILGYVLRGKQHSSEAEAKTILTKLGITEFDKDIHTLSGGQKKRVALAKTLVEPAEVLILDEPTNHLDIESIRWLETFLMNYKGAVLIVSHDRYFVRKVANRLLVFEDGTTHLYQFGYEEYQEKLDREAAESGDDYRKNPAALGGAISQNGGTQQSKGTQETGGKKAYYNPGKERSKIEKKVKKAEEELAVKEEKLDALKQELLRPEYQSSYSKLTEIQGEIDALEEEIMADMENWEELSQQLEELES